MSDVVMDARELSERPEKEREAYFNTLVGNIPPVPKQFCINAAAARALYFLVRRCKERPEIIEDYRFVVEALVWMLLALHYDSKYWNQEMDGREVESMLSAHRPKFEDTTVHKWYTSVFDWLHTLAKLCGVTAMDAEPLEIFNGPLLHFFLYEPPSRRPLEDQFWNVMSWLGYPRPKDDPDMKDSDDEQLDPTDEDDRYDTSSICSKRASKRQGKYFRRAEIDKDEAPAGLAPE